MTTRQADPAADGGEEVQTAGAPSAEQPLQPNRSARATASENAPPRVGDANGSFGVVHQTTESEEPFKAYESATCSLVYSLSEAMFASLLAAYILGAAGALLALQQSPNPSPQLLLRIPSCLTISATYAFVTTAFYLKYHMAILTMPSLPLGNVARDFVFAVAQGVTFALAMACPALLPVCVFGLVTVANFRFASEIKKLTRHFLYYAIKKGPPNRSALDEDRIANQIETAFRDNGFVDWVTPTGLHRYGAGAVAFGGLLYGCLALYRAFTGTQTWVDWGTPVVDLAVLGIVVSRSWPIIQRSAEFKERALKTADDRYHLVLAQVCPPPTSGTARRHGDIGVEDVEHDR